MPKRTSPFQQWAKITADVTIESEEDKAQSTVDRALVQRAAAAPRPVDPALVLQGGPSPEPEGVQWFRVVSLNGLVKVRRYRQLKAGAIAFLQVGEIVEATEVQGGWAQLAGHERDKRDISPDCESWVLIDGSQQNWGVLLEPYVPRWWQVVHEPRVAIRKKADLEDKEAPAIEWLQAGEIFEAADFVGGWVALSAEERELRGISKCCGSWVLLDGNMKAKGLGRLIKAIPPPGQEVLIGPYQADNIT